MTTYANRVIAILLLLALFALPGCIVWDIRDEMKNANAQLGDVRIGLAKLDDTNERLDKTISDLQKTNALVEGVQKQLAVLNTINVSLSRLDVHLAALRRTLGKLDSAIPFLDLGSEPVSDAPPVATAPPPAAATPEGGAAAATVPADQTTQAAQPDKPREPMFGIWTSRWPDNETALVILDDNTFILSTAAREHTGTWKREGKKIVLKNAQPEKHLDAQGKTVDGPPREHILEIVSSVGRSIAARLDGKTIIFARP